ncbi:putative lipooligosaccharide transport system, periplasmic component (LptA family) [Campylobacter pinnipediorum subsp. caledonicus]|uniref:Putative lipooligosaccharide transport system, periplasmic component (LptA family) n=1 Tax=Campylobacter pinnipediorum subsp. caledonicus TaxID=1874362 RepID=A0A1S6U8T4_9BACT|nr:lipopolysaccharide transport periplasmic protein LptA [Campylobacter pinnipediorum]AQW86458.1 putative lipooligosaccharide transport system, periplasmic component (LptA family) [Campylobacter pinnipediorum subsp. caledonicus]AQW88110.1 putative lipooligosaccharide transport system, periplasmic component (LptA family) [Campylobacter pinnipediorum subsp. caledonicus]OPA71552.1 lipopolysaccharide transport periplasmic protein LptA [Campylobacter pinnipediorum subsp. caledonicus]
MDKSKLIIIFFLAISALKAQQIEITSDSFFADEKKQISEFFGNVKIKKGNYDELKAEKVVVNFNNARQPIKYTATNNVYFKVMIHDKTYEGNGNLLTYEPQQEIYTIAGKAHLREIQTDKNVYGQQIIVNQKTGVYNVVSSEQQPVKFIFQVKEDKK